MYRLTRQEAQKAALQVLKLENNDPSLLSRLLLLKHYARHLPGCYSEREWESDCDCGLYDLVGELPRRKPDPYRWEPGGKWVRNDELESQREKGRFVPAD